MPKLLEQIRGSIRVRQMSRSTELAYLQWVCRFILFHDKRHPNDLGKVEIEAFLTHLAVNRGVSPLTQNQALQAIFLYEGAGTGSIARQRHPPVHHQDVAG